MIANARIAAEAYGMRATLTVRQNAEGVIRPARDGDDPIVPVASLTFAPPTPHALRDASWVRAMLRRKMVRAEFDEQVKLEPSARGGARGDDGRRAPRVDAPYHH